MVGALTFALLMLALPPWFQPAAASGDELPWIENPSLSLSLTVFNLSVAPGEAPIDSCESLLVCSGEIFDSADYQSMLLLPCTWKKAYILNLATGEASVYPQAVLPWEDGHPQMPDSAQGQSAGMFITDEEGQIHLSLEECDILVGPVPPLVGAIERADLESRQPIYARRARCYQADPGKVRQLALVEQSVEIVAFFGTWCSTCKHHLPALMATVDQAGNDNITITYVGLDEDMSEPAEWIYRCGIHTTPTMVVIRDGNEVGRIEDEPKVSVEADLVTILFNGSID